ncbi:MAG: hypothetical protein RLZZ324_135 [Candidatus Parcubacteria bacterium]|jgi:HlyD family secretion protein
MKRHIPLFLLVIGVAALGIASVFAYQTFMTDHARADFATANVTRADIVRDVSFTGIVAPSTSADLSFERAGMVSSVAVKAGDKVVKGQVLATLSAADIAAQVEQARAAVLAAQARLDAMRRGTRPEALAVQDAQVATAESAAREARTGLVDKVVSAYATADDAVHGKADPFFIGPLGPNPRLSYDPLDASLTADLASRRVTVEAMMKDWQASVRALTASGDVLATSADAKTRLTDISAFLEECAHALDRTTVAANPALAQATLDGYKAGISAARASVNGAVSALSGGEEKIRTSTAMLALSKSQQTLAAAPATAEDVAAQDAAVRQSQAALDAANAQLAKAALRSPVSGTVAHVNVSAGETASPSVIAVSVLAGDRFEIDALASEDQIASFSVGDGANVTLDAYGAGEAFKATVTRVDPAPATRAGQTGYPVIIRFDVDDARVKVGMTANAVIRGASKTGVLVIPRGSLLEGASGAEALRLTAGRFIRVPVKTGISSSSAVEITDGLAEGDVVADLSAAR